MKPDSSQWIAVTGLKGRFPGARDLAEFWRNLRDGVEAIRFLSDDQLLRSGVPPAELRDPQYVKAASILDDIDLFAASFFGLSPKDAAIMDPQHRLFLECAWEALENAGWSPDQFPGRIGVYAGSGMNTYLIHNLLKNRELLSNTGIFLLKQTGNDKDVLATRVSYQLNLTGPSISVQTACSTSLVAIHLACQSLLNGECDLALAGGVTIEVPHGRGYSYREGEILSRDGHCRAFDAEASGTIFGSGVGLVVLRRYDDALRDGDQIRAVVRGSAINNDGARKVGYLAPSVTGQAEAVSEALAVAGVDARTISYIEAHGTGTRVGDPIEVEALARAFRETTNDVRFCGIGSLKPSIGHLDAAAGVASFIKTVLALEHREVPPSLNFSKPNPLIDFDHSPFFVNARLRRWNSIGETPRRAGVTSLGIGGTNAHVILEEAPERTPSGRSREWQVLTLSAKTPAALDAASQRFADYLRGDCPNIADVAFTCHLGRKAFPHRRAVVCRESEDAAIGLLSADAERAYSSLATERDRTLAFVFPGQGSQFPGMGQGLYQAEPEFKKAIDFASDILRPLLGLDLRDILYPSIEDAERASELLDQTRITQPAILAIEYALTALWRTWGVEPAAMIGHSIGEFAAAAAAGVFSIETALEIVAERGRLMQNTKPGAMTAVMLSESEVAPFLGEELSLAAINADEQCVVSGPEKGIIELEKKLTAKAARWHRLRVSHAFHSAMMDPVLESFAEFVSKYHLSTPQVPYISSVTGDWITDEDATNPSYWARQLRRTVRFKLGVARLLENSETIFLEVGPGNSHSALIAQHPSFTSKNEVIGSTNSRNSSASDSETIARAVAQLWVSGGKIDWCRFHAGEDRRRVSMPTYPFERQRFWVDPDDSAVAGAEVRNEASDDGMLFRPIWKRKDLTSRLPTNDQGPWLVLTDQHGLGAELVDHVRRTGQICVAVSPAKSFSKNSPDSYSIDPRNPEDFARLVSELELLKRTPRRIVHLWSIINPTAENGDRNSLEDAKSLNFYSLLNLARALAAMDNGHAVQVAIVSNCLFDADEETAQRPERALILGPSGTIPKEFPKIVCHNVDLDLKFNLNGHTNDAIREAVTQLLGEIASPTIQLPVAYRRSRRWIRSFEPVNLKNKTAMQLVDQGVYLITGGLGGIGLVLAKSIASSVRARIVLLSRTSFPAREEWNEWTKGQRESDRVAYSIRQIQEIEGLGSEVMVLSADVTDASSMKRAAIEIHVRFGCVNGIIHAAGLIDDAPILEKDRSRCEAILTPKVDGTLVLESTFAEDHVDFLVLMSSISSALCPAGQADYAAANAFLDAFAQSQQNQGKTRVLSVQWPRWREVGLAANPRRPECHPLLGACAIESQGRLEFNKTLDFDRDWIVAEHRLKDGVGLLPATGYIEIIRAAVSDRLRKRPVSIKNFHILAPTIVTQGSRSTMRLSFSELAKGYSFVAFTDDAPSVAWSQRAAAQVEFGSAHEPPKRKLEAILDRCRRELLSFDESHQNDNQSRHIEFGPRWRNLKWIRLGRGEAVSFLALPESYESDLGNYRIHPATLDMATGSAMFLIRGYSASTDLYVPISYDEITIYRDLPAECFSHIRARGKPSVKDPTVTFDIEIIDQSGNVVIDISGFSLRRVSDSSILSARRTHSKSVVGVDHQPLTFVQSIERPDGISNQEGEKAFKQILTTVGDANVVVFPSDFRSLWETNGDSTRSPSDRQEIERAEDTGSDEVEGTLSRWWKEILGIDRVGVDDDFFDAGGQSLTGVRLLAKIKRRYGIELKLAALFEAPTIGKLSKLIRNSETKTPFSSIVPIRTKGTTAPLFLLHGVGGRVLGFHNLIKHLKPDQPVYGIEYSLNPSLPAKLRLEELARDYIREVRVVQPEGPYHFLGYSFGGLLGYEMAQQLSAEGQEIAMLGMIDTFLMNEGEVAHRSSWRRVRDKVGVLRFHARRTFRIGGAAYVREQLSMRLDDRIGRGRQHIYSMLEKRGRAIPKFFEHPRDVNWYAANRYQPRPYRGQIILFRAATADGLIDERYGYELGWSSLALGGVRVHEIAGTHHDIIREPNVRALAEKVTDCLAELFLTTRSGEPPDGHVHLSDPERSAASSPG